MESQAQKSARLERIKKRIADLEREQGKLVADYRKDMKTFEERKRLTELVHAGLVIERAGLLGEYQSEDFLMYLRNYKKGRGDVHGD